MILPAQQIRRLCQPDFREVGEPELPPMVRPFFERTRHNGMTFGLGPAGYDVRIGQELHFNHGDFHLASTIEQFDLPDDVLAQVCDKSTWARRGITVQNTIIEPGWRGFLTLEITMQAHGHVHIKAGDPIAQIVFMRLEQPTERPYEGKYQDQEAGPQPAREDAQV